MTTYEIWDLIISGVAAFGTIAAVIAALYLSKKQEKIQIAASALKLVTFGPDTPKRNVLCIRLINRTKSPVKISSISWTFGKKCPVACLQMFGNLVLGSSPAPPFVMSYGEQRDLMIDWNEWCNGVKNIGKETSMFVKRYGVFMDVNTPLLDKPIRVKASEDVRKAFAECQKDQL